MVTKRSGGKANITDMAALLDHADSDGLLRDSGGGDSHEQQWVAVCFQENTRFQKSSRRCTSIRRVQLWSSARRSQWLGGWCAASLGSRCVEVTQRTVLPAEEESQRETASDTP